MKTKKFDCVEMKRKSQEIIFNEIKKYDTGGRTHVLAEGDERFT